MKYVKGITLDEVLRGLRYGREEIVKKYPLGTLLTIFQKVCDAVAFAHSKEVVHRDLKPENIMIGTYGEVFVMDWGLAKQMATVVRPDSENPVETAMQSKPRDPLRGFQTLHGVVIGTPPYVSPEQARGELDAIDQRSDVYVLGAILYAILALRAPVTGGTLEEILLKITKAEIQPPAYYNQFSKPSRSPNEAEKPDDNEIALVHCPNRRIPEGLSAVAMKALQLNTEDRYQTVQEMQCDLSAYQGGFAPKAERAGVFRQFLLFTGRHKREMALLLACALVFNVIVVAFIVQLTEEKNRAVMSEQREKGKETELARALGELRGTAPTFAAEASSLLDQQKPDEALEKIDYAIEQLPNDATFYSLRGNILQSLLRFDEAAASYEDALRRNPKDKNAAENIALTRRIITQIGTEGQVTPAILRELHAAMVAQKRVGEALGMLDEIGHDRQLFFSTWKAAFEKRGLKERFETKEDDTLNIDLSRVPVPDLRKVRGAPVSGLNLDDTRIVDISALKGLPLNTLSLSHTSVRDLSPLAGMPLHNLNLDGTPIGKTEGLFGLPLVSLRLSGTRIEHLGGLRGMKLEQLSIAGCRNVKDIKVLTGMPLQKLDMSRSGVNDLTPLENCPVRELNLEGCTDLVDLRPLMQMKSLDSVVIPAHCKDIEFLRNHPSIKRLSYTRLTQPVYEFWEQWDAKRPPPAEATASEILPNPAGPLPFPPESSSAPLPPPPPPPDGPAGRLKSH